ncbi:hypothetical protein Fmac_026143 [Flemingia macrophylla]|uniref:Pentatricopeptide repeat-containing protein n=1 Tax=Flemingia macrophylla TaxID=520843 RepID=A0ABD1LE13_9FABA
MNRPKAIVANLRFLESLLASRVIATRSLQLTRGQVTRFTLYTPSPLLGRFPYIDQKLNFSSKPNPIVELVLTRDWSKGLEQDLERCFPSLTHETVVYVLKRLEGNPANAWCFFNWVSAKRWFRASSSLYSLVLRILATEETIRQFWITLWSMERKGFYFDEEMYFPILAGFRRKKMDQDRVSLTRFYNRSIQENAKQRVVTKLVDIISGSEWGDEVIGELAKLKIHLSDILVTRILKELRNNPLKAYKFFHWVGKQSSYEHNTVTYNAVARVLARSESIEEFWSVIEKMKSVGHQLDIDTYIKISRMLQRNGLMEDAVKLYELMMDSSYKPLVQDCSLLLKRISASDRPNLDLVFRVSKKFESTGHTLPKAIYDGIHRCLTGAGKFDHAEHIVLTMRNAGHEPDNITYSQVVFGLCKMRRFDEAYKVLEEMESCGCIPDIKTWTILIQGHCDGNEVDKALLCFSKMIVKGCDPDANLLDVLIDSFLGQKRIDDACKLLVEVLSQCNTSPWQGTYKKMIENLLGIDKFEEALDLMCLMRKHKYVPFTEPFVQYISKFGSVEDALKFLKAWSMESPRSHSIYVHVFKSLLGEGRLSEAKDLLSKIRRRISKRKKIRELFDTVKNCTVQSLSCISQ